MQRIEDSRHPAFRAAAALSSPLQRAVQGRFLVEGGRLVRRALASSAAVVEAFVVDPMDGVDDIVRELAERSLPTWVVPARLVSKLIGTGYDTKVEAVAVVARRPLTDMPSQGLLLVAEEIQDPRNVGVLLRTAEAAGVTAVALSDTGADPYGRPAVRSSTGSILRQAVYLAADLPALLRRLHDDGVRLVGSSAHATVPPWEADLTGDVAVVLGNESTGLSDAARAEVDVVVGLPVAGGCDSLNVTVAAGALLYEAVRQRYGITQAPQGAASGGSLT